MRAKQGPVNPGYRGTAERREFLGWLTAHGIDPSRVPEDSRVVIAGNHITWQELRTRYVTGRQWRPKMRTRHDGLYWAIRRRRVRITTPPPVHPNKKAQP